jgi:tRNA(Arg) A34 adenosine deaminase TadA
MTYQDLSKEWRIAFGLSVGAFRHGSLPIGCLVIDSKGKIISQQRAHMVYGDRRSNVTQHAEMVALSKIPVPALEQRLTLYTTVEPCPMCFGATNVARIACLHFGTPDPWAGSTDLVNGNWYMRRKQMDIRPAEPAFQRIMAIFVVYAMMKKPKGKSFCKLDNEFVERWALIVPDIKQIIQALTGLDFQTLRSPEAIFNMLASF